VLILELFSSRQGKEKLGTVVILAYEIKYKYSRKTKKNIRISQSWVEDKTARNIHSLKGFYSLLGAETVNCKAMATYLGQKKHSFQKRFWKKTLPFRIVSWYR
jgi:hypothetical protein